MNRAAGIDSPTGSLIGRNGVINGYKKSDNKLGEWITFEEIVKGNALLVVLKDMEAARSNNARPTSASGASSLQMHNEQTVIEFRKIEAKQL